MEPGTVAVLRINLINSSAMRKRLLLAGAALMLASALHAQAKDGVPDQELVPQREMPKVAPREEIPLALRWLMHPTKRGMMLNLPVVDTDPNRGTTAGIMPIWVIREDGTDRIKHIHAPSLTYNKDFGPIATYRYYLYPEPDSSLIVRGAAGKYEHEALAQFEDASFLDTELDLALRLWDNIESGPRFFGIGPDTPKKRETNYKDDYLQYRVTVGAPLSPRNRWRAHISDRLTADKITNGPIPGLPGFADTFPGLAAAGRRQNHELRLILDYDSRNHGVTTSRGAYLQTFAEYSVKSLASMEEFSRYGLDARYFHPWGGNPQRVAAAQLKFEQLLGDAPFWLMPRLGGKYTLRSYGEGRYTDRGLITANVEQRFTVYQAKMAGVATEFEAAPFAGLGTVFNGPERMARRYARPVVGLATRAVARPQVVGSIDFGVGQEGVAVFMDINYSF